MHLQMIVQHEVDVAGFQEFNTDKNNLRFVVDELNKIAGDGIYRCTQPLSVTVCVHFHQFAIQCEIMLR